MEDDLIWIPLSCIRFYPRWKEYEMLQASLLNYTLAETQWEIDWTTLLSLANQPGSSLEQIHIFALSHIMRRVSYIRIFKEFFFLESTS